MIDTNRIQSGFDAELMLGGKWFFTAMKTLEENGLLGLPAGATVTEVSVILEEAWDLAIEISGLFTVKAEMEIIGGQFLFTTDFNNASFIINMPGFGQLAQTPVLQKVAGDAEHENAMAITSLVPDEGIVKFATPKPPENSLSIGFLDAIPSSIPIFNDQADILYNHLHAVKALFDDLSMNSNGLAVAGKSGPSELFQPNPATITGSIYEQDELKSLTYKVLSTSEEVTLDLAEVLDRARNGELVPPLKVKSTLEDPVIQIPAGKVCCPVLIPTRIRRKDTVITRIKFSDELELNTADAVTLQDSAGVYLSGLQLIHPKNANPYFRAPANNSENDNFESLPDF